MRISDWSSDVCSSDLIDSIAGLEAILGHEAREEQVMLQGVDRRDAKQEADDRIGGRPASLAQDRRLPRPRAAHKIMPDQELTGRVLAGNEGALLSQPQLHLVGLFGPIAGPPDRRPYMTQPGRKPPSLR